MKKLLGMVLIILMSVSYPLTCFAFPDTGKYESEERSRTSDTDEPTGFPLWKLEINKSSSYYGTLVMNAKGVWSGYWSVPLSITTNDDGRYPIEAILRDDNRSKLRIELQETSDSSFSLYTVNLRDGSKRFAATMIKIE